MSGSLALTLSQSVIAFLSKVCPVVPYYWVFEQITCDGTHKGSRDGIRIYRQIVDSLKYERS